MMDTTDSIEGTDGATLLRVWIAEKNLKRDDVAALLDVTPATVSCLTNGQRKPRLHVALRIQKIMGIPVEVWE